MGWNELVPRAAHPLLAGIEPGAHAYFIHSFHLVARDPGDVVAVAAYGGDVTAMVARDNVAGMQFHPEKSQQAGLRLLANFLRWRP
jgi:glutamine amidotransferase